MAVRDASHGHLQFQHTQLGAYLVGLVALVYAVGDRGQVRRPGAGGRPGARGPEGVAAL
jgi:hypothetical protein